MIPENKATAVTAALQQAFGVDHFDHIEALTSGLSGALVFKIVVAAKPYLLRVAGDFGDPSFYYGCMKAAANNEIAPGIHYMSIEDRISITDFITAAPFTVEKARQSLPGLLRKLHALPKFPFRINYFDSIEKFLTRFNSTDALPGKERLELNDIYQEIMNVYPRNDVANWVSSHNDSKPENIVFDGTRPWLVDWESAFLNDPYLDLAIVANFVVHNDDEERQFLQTYFQGNVDEYKHARFFVMRQILHLYYFIFLRVFDKGETPFDKNEIQRHDFRKFHDDMWKGKISLAGADSKREYAVIHLESFLSNSRRSRFTESLKVLSFKN